jgi:hypothetical protein
VLLQFVDYEDEKEVNHIVAGKQLKSRADEIRNMYEVPFYLTDMQILQQIASDVPEIQEVMEVYENTQFTVEEKSALNNALNAMTREERAYSDAEGKIL